MSLPCTAVGNPGPLIKWYAGFDASLLQNDSKYTIFENGTLQIKSVSKKEAKVYKCTAENMVASIAKDTEVELACKWKNYWYSLISLLLTSYACCL